MPRRHSHRRNSQPSDATPAMSAPSLRFTAFNAVLLGHYPALSIIGSGASDPQHCHADEVILSAWHVSGTCVINDQEFAFEGVPVFRNRLDGASPHPQLFLRSNWLQPVEVNGTHTSLEGCPLPTGWFLNAGLSPEKEAMYRSSFGAAASIPAMDLTFPASTQTPAEQKQRDPAFRAYWLEKVLQEMEARLRALQAETPME